jgi:hypothetical protein
MKKYGIILAALLMLSGCAANTKDTTENTVENTEATVSETEHATAPVQEVGYEGMTEVLPEALNEGSYDISVDSSSSMFKIAACILNVSDSQMTADIIIDSKSYGYLFLGSGEEAKAADETSYISYTTNDKDQSVFTVPVEALDKEISCAAFSVKKQDWYDRTLVFRADSLPDEAFKESRTVTAESLSLGDGSYTVDVALEGGSGRASVQSPALITVENGEISAEIIWSSNKYDYMVVEGEKILPESTEENSVFEIPVKGFDAKLPVSADTTAMSEPHEIEYTLFFDSATIKEAE